MRHAIYALALIATTAQAAEVQRVIDGDTFVATHEGRTESIRIRGIDTPEMRCRCETECQKAQAAKEALEAFIGSTVSLTDTARDRYGRLLANAHNERGDIAQHMLNTGHARHYGKGRRTWCD